MEGAVSFRGLSAKKYVKDVADGYINVTAANLRRFSPEELRQLLNTIAVVQREIRAIQVEEEDYDAIKKKNWRLQNLSRTNLVVNTFIKHRRIKV